MEIRYRDRTPAVDPEAYVASTAVLSGQVRIGPGSCVLHGAVLAADGGPVKIGANCVVMEHAVLRGTPRHPLTLGDHVLAGPHSYLTGCTVGDEVFIATGAMVFNGALVSFVRATTISWAGKTISLPTGRRPRNCAACCPMPRWPAGRTAASCGARCGTWPASRASASS
jgi:carbonic anhydrase/acetyltransferase-like protein (isoleucine patch superfamily)